jgi:hypothetical protein
MKTNPIFQFGATTDTGINEVPAGAKVLIVDSDGSGTPKEVIKIALGTLDETSTISDFLNDNSLFKEITAEVGDISGGTY